jgi:hypothetical protein
MASRAGNSFGRSAPRYKPQPTVLVICEDSKSGKRYLEDATRYYRVHITVEVAHCGKTDPKGIVAEAIRRQKQFDRVFCTIDRDTHPSFNEAFVLAKTSSKVTIIPSYPCFEFWYLLHFGFTRRSYGPAGGRSAGDCLVDDLRTKEGMAEYAKGGEENMFAILLPRLPAASRFAAQILIQAVQDGEMNPSTCVHELLAYFQTLSVPQPK